MGIIQPLTEQHPETTLWTIISLVSGKVADETTTRAEEEISVMIIETGESIEHKAVHRHVNWSREETVLVKANPVDVVVIGHGILN
jgi:hypothetical protein